MVVSPPGWWVVLTCQSGDCTLPHTPDCIRDQHEDEDDDNDDDDDEDGD